jgi:hypothetical protein
MYRPTNTINEISAYVSEFILLEKVTTLPDRLAMTSPKIPIDNMEKTLIFAILLPAKIP